MQVHRYDNAQNPDSSTYGYFSLFRCASPLVCPVCGAIIRARRAQDIVHAGRRMLEEGFTFVFVTFTAAHTIRSSLSDFISRFNAARRDLKSGRRWQSFIQRWNLRHSITTVETTDDVPGSIKKSGWHYHAHSIMFLERLPLNENEAAAFENELTSLWLKTLDGVGLSASAAHGCHIELPRTRVGVVTKDSLKSLAAYVSKVVAWETTAMNTKTGNQPRRMSVWQLQKLALTTNPELLQRYAEYMRAVKGISFMQWTPGLKQFVGLPEQSDAELLQGKQGTLVHVLTADDLRAVASQGGQRKLLKAAEADGLQGILDGLKAAHAGLDIESREVWNPDKSPYFSSQ